MQIKKKKKGDSGHYVLNNLESKNFADISAFSQQSSNEEKISDPSYSDQ